MSSTSYADARREGLRELHALQASQQDPYLPVLSEILPSLNHMPQVSLGIHQISMKQIVGTVTSGRTTAFSRSFHPLLELDSEFSSKWSLLYDDVVEHGLNQPIKVMEYYNQYYVIEGNKRVSVSRALDSPTIDADVIRVLPEPEDSERYRIYQEFLVFYADTGIENILFAHEGGYPHLCSLAGHRKGEKWSQDDVLDFLSCYNRFVSAYETERSVSRQLLFGDAFLLYIGIYGYDKCKVKTPNEIRDDIRRIHNEYSVAAANKPAALISHPSEERPSILKSMLHRSPQHLRCAFLYASSADRSGWTYWHELGRKTVEEIFGNQIETTVVNDVTPSNAENVMEDLIAKGFTLIFATSPILLDACIRESALHPECKILNCSLLAIYHNVRSYYLRIYEAKFILGAVAGAMADDNYIGYIADYPIAGMPASVNAFALGAQMVNPRARILLDWSTITGHDPESAMRKQGVHIIANRDIGAPIMETRCFGLYDINDDRIVNLAMPVWNWSKVYEGVIRSILVGAWSEEGDQHADRALTYYMGMSSDAIDIFCSEKLPPRLSKLIELLREQLKSGYRLFSGPIYDQHGTLRVAEGDSLSREQIIDMKYFVSNITGSLPDISSVTESAKALISLQGIESPADIILGK